MHLKDWRHQRQWKQHRVNHIIYNFVIVTQQPPENIMVKMNNWGSMWTAALHVHGEIKVKSWFDLSIIRAHILSFNTGENRKSFCFQILSTVELHLLHSGSLSLRAFHYHVSGLHIAAEMKTKIRLKSVKVVSHPSQCCLALWKSS